MTVNFDRGVKQYGPSSNIEEYANTTSATIPTALHQSVAAGKIKKGDIVVLAAFGAGFTWGGALMRWAV